MWNKQKKFIYCVRHRRKHKVHKKTGLLNCPFFTKWWWALGTPRATSVSLYYDVSEESRVGTIAWWRWWKASPVWIMLFIVYIYLKAQKPRPYLWLVFSDQFSARTNGRSTVARISRLCAAQTETTILTSKIYFTL